MTEPFSQPVNPMTANTNANKDYAKIMRDLQLEHDQKLLNVFNSVHGDLLLDLWDDFYVRQPVVIPGTQPGEDSMREGRNSFIRKIRTTVKRARATV